MHAADMLEDSFPHGTPDGYANGCRGAHCPSVMSCRDVYSRYKGDWGFKRAIDAGTPLEEILRREAAAREGVEARDRAAARAERAKPAKTPKPKTTPRPKKERPAPAADPLEVYRQQLTEWRAHRKELYAVVRAAERAVTDAIAARDRALAAFDEFVEAGEPQKPETPKSRQRRSDIAEHIARLHSEGLADDAVAEELGITTAYAGIVRRRLNLPAIAKPRKARAPKEPRQPRQVLGHGTNASYARGCRCDACREAQRAYHRQWMEDRRKNVESIPAEHHGTAYGYQLGCRSRKSCPATPSCPDASLAEGRRRRREAGIPEAPDRVPAEPVRVHVRALMAAGMTMDAIAAGADVHRSRVGDLIYGRSDPGRKGQFAAEIEAERAKRLLALQVTS
jgi:hypothetical protein